MVDLATNVVSLLDSLITCVSTFGRQCVHWKDAHEENPIRLDRLGRDVCEFINEIDSDMDQLSIATCGSDRELVSYQQLCNLQTQLKDLQRDISTLVRSRKRYKLYPQVRHEKMIALESRLQEYRTFASERLSVFVPEGFVVIRNVDRASTGVITMDFDAEDENGCSLTYEGKFKDAIFTQTTTSAVGAVAQGPGGVGKSCALQAIALLPETDKRFPGGTLYVNVGADGTLPQLLEKIAYIVERAGGKEQAKIIRENRNFLQATQVAGDWFKARPCLFLIDDVWLANGIKSTSIRQLINLAKNPRSAIALTARDRAVNLGKIVQFEEREQLGHKARDILLKNANLNPPSSLDADDAFNRILHLCGGLPIMLSGVGATIGYLARERCRDDQERAWRYFLSKHWEMAEHSFDQENSRNYLMRTTKIALDLISENQNEMNCKEMFIALCVLRKQQYMPLHVAKGLWNVSPGEAHEFFKLLEQFSIARSRQPVQGEIEIGFHDVYLQLAEELAEKKGTRQKHSRALLCSYARALGEDNPIEPRFRRWWMGDNPIESRFRQWWGRVKDDGYIYDNVCWQLKRGGLYNELLWLMTNPDWVIKRLKSYKKWQVDEDFRHTVGSLTVNGQVGPAEKREARDFLNVLCLAIHMSAKHVQETDWSGTPWFQLCGRMVHLEHENMFVKRFIGSVRERAPRPWLNPSVGCLPAAEDSLRHEIDIEGRILCHGEVASTLYLFYLVSVDGKELVSLKRYNLDSRTETEPEVVLESNNGSSNFDIFKSRVAFCSSCAVLCVGLKTGEIVLVNLNKRRSIDNSEIVETPRHVAADNDKARFSFRSWCCFSNKSVEDREDSLIISAATSPSVTSRYDTEILIGYEKEISSIAVSCKAEKLIILPGYIDGMVIFWEKNGIGWRSEKMKSNTERVGCEAMNSDASRVLSGYDETVRVWEMQGGEWRGVELKGHTDQVDRVAMSSNGSRVVSFSYGKMMVWEMQGSEWKGVELKGDTGWENRVAMSSDGSRVVSSYFEKMMVWEMQGSEWKGVELKSHTGRVDCVATSSDGSRVVSGCYNGTVRVWEMQGSEWKGVDLKRHTDRVHFVAMSSNGSRVVSGSNDRTVKVWEMQGSEWRGVERKGHTDWGRYVAMSSDGSRAVSNSYGKVMVWEMQGSEWRGVELKGHTDWVNCVAMNSDGSRVVSGSDDRTVRVWEMQGSEWRGVELKGHTDWVWCVAMNSDGSRVVSGSRDRTVRVWEMQGSEWKGVELKGHTYLVDCVAMSSDGSRVVSSSYWEVMVWEMQGTECKGVELKGHTGSVGEVKIVANGYRVGCYTSSFDLGYRYWTWSWEDGEWSAAVENEIQDYVSLNLMGSTRPRWTGELDDSVINSVIHQVVEPLDEMHEIASGLIIFREKRSRTAHLDILW